MLMQKKTSMASLSFNTTRLRTPTVQSHKPISNFTKLNKISYSCSINHSKKWPRLHHFRPNSVSDSSVSIEQEEEEIDEEEEGEDDDPTAELSYLDPETDPESISEWEVDFCSRPIFDIRGKKVWELVVCDDSLSLQYTKYFPNNVINSVTLKEAISSICDVLGVPLPDKIRFFR